MRTMRPVPHVTVDDKAIAFLLSCADQVPDRLDHENGPRGLRTIAEDQNISAKVVDRAIDAWDRAASTAQVPTWGSPKFEANRAEAWLAYGRACREAAYALSLGWL